MTTPKDIEEIVSKVLTGYPRLPHEQKELQKELIQAFTQHHEAEVERARSEGYAVGYAQCEADHNIFTPTKTDKTTEV